MIKRLEKIVRNSEFRQATNNEIINNEFGFQLILITVNINIDTNANSVKT